MIDPEREFIANRPINTQKVDDLLYTQLYTQVVSHLFNPIITPRIQQMIDILLANQELICHYSSGHIHLHYHQNDIKAKIEHTLTIELSPRTYPEIRRCLFLPGN